MCRYFRRTLLNRYFNIIYMLYALDSFMTLFNYTSNYKTIKGDKWVDINIKTALIYVK